MLLYVETNMTLLGGARLTDLCWVVGVYRSGVFGKDLCVMAGLQQGSVCQSTTLVHNQILRQQLLDGLP